MICPSPYKMRNVLGVTAACLLLFSFPSWADSGGNPSSILEVDKVRTRTSPYIGRYTIEVQANCLAHSPLPNQVENYWVSWDGPCLNGYVDGKGVRRVKAAGRALSAHLGVYESGKWIFQDGYEIALGKIIHLTKLDNGLMKRQEVSNPDGASLPTWASDLIAELPRAKEEWAANVQYRLQERSRVMSMLNKPKNEDEDEDEEDNQAQGLVDLFTGKDDGKN